MPRNGLHCPCCGRFVKYDGDECACGQNLADGEQARITNLQEDSDAIM